jgi:putative nucleotidyltransferase with HDIG domain
MAAIFGSSQAVAHWQSMMNRAEAYKLVCEYTQSESLRKHMLAVEAAMRAYARRFGEDEEKWGIVGLLHDFDYQRWPNPPDHPLQGAAILAERGYPADVIYAIKSHADYLTDCPRVSLMDKALYACDELSGLCTAAALVRPEGIRGMTAKSVRKKMQQKSFAANVNREDIERGAVDLGVALDAHIQFVIDAMATVAAELGLAGKGDPGA